jgi:dihydrolipoamide dehydrogenase
LARRDQVVNNLDDASQVEWALNTGIDVVRGRARLVGPRQVEVRRADGSTRVITARHAVVLDTGSRARVPDTPGLAEARPWTSRDVTQVHEIPRRVVLVGGGVVACEAATWLRGLGAAEVTIIARDDRLLPRFEPFVSELIGGSFDSSGVRVILGESVEGVRRDGPADTGYGRIHGGEVTVELHGRSISADEIVVAAGREPQSDGLGLGAFGLPDGGYIPVDDQLTVTGVEGEWLYAIGDVTGRSLLTHMGKYQARIVGEVIAARARGEALEADPWLPQTDVADHGRVPQVVFTDPEIGSVGRTEAQARAEGFAVQTAEYDMSAVAGAFVLRDNYVGRAKLVVDRDRQVLLGATFVGPDVAELTHSATVAVVGEVPVPTLWHAVPSYPTVSEVWLRLLEELLAQRHTG